MFRYKSIASIIILTILIAIISSTAFAGIGNEQGISEENVHQTHLFSH